MKLNKLLFLVVSSMVAQFIKTSEYPYSEERAPQQKLVAQQSDGKKIMVESGYGEHGSIIIKRFEPNGQQDQTFGQFNGSTKVFYGNFPYATNLKILPDDKIEIEGETNFTTSPVNFKFRLTKNGSLDATFGENGFENN